MELDNGASNFIVLNGVTIDYNSKLDMYNLTAINKAGGEELFRFMDLKSTTEFIESLNRSTGKTKNELIVKGELSV